MNYQNMTREELLAELAKVSQRLEAAERRLTERENACPNGRSISSKDCHREVFASRYGKDSTANDELGDAAKGKVRDSDVDWQATFDAVTDLIMVLDGQNRIVRANKAMIDALKLPAENIIGARCFTLVHGTQTPPAFCPHAKLMRYGQPQQAEVFQSRFGGTFSVSVAPIRDREGKMIGSVHIARDMTERKQMEEALRESEAKYRELFNNSVDIVYVHDLKGNFLSVNAAAEKLLGYSVEQIVGLNFRDLVDPESSALAEQNFRLKRDAGFERTGPYEIRVRAKDGTRTWLEINSRAVERDGKKWAIHGVARPIGARKKAEEALRANEERYRMIFTHVPVGITHFDSNGVVVDCNDPLADIMGAARENILGFNLLDGVENQEVLQAIRDCFAGRIGIYEGEYHSVVGRKKTSVRAMFGPIVSEDGGFLGGVGLYEDVTDRKRSEQMIAEREQMLAGILAASPIGIGLSGFDRILQWANGAWLQMFGFADELEYVGSGARILYASDEEFDRVGLLVQVSLAEWKVTETEARMVRKNGTPFDAYIRIRAVGTPEELKGYIVSIEDISEKKKAQREQEELRAQLLQAQKMEAIGTLAGGIAHDFNNILQVTLGYTELLLADKTETDPDYADLQSIKEGAGDGAELVRMLLTFSRKVKPKLVPLNLNRQILQVEKMLRRTIPKMIDIRLDLTRDLQEVHADPVQMEQVLMNLAVNARDAMPEGGVLVMESQNVTLPREDQGLWADGEPGDYVMISVSDTGHGMHEATVQHIFEPFFSTKEPGRGTGLGLAMVYGIVRQHRGHVDCYSEVGRGTSFKVYLPTLSAPDETRTKSPRATSFSGTETILLADDDDKVRELATRFLRSAGYTVLKARTGLEGLELSKDSGHRISLVLLDLFMPTMGGKDCMRELLRMNPQAKILVSSGYSTNAAISESLALGARGFIRKPFKCDELLTQVRRVLDERP